LLSAVFGKATKEWANLIGEDEPNKRSGPTPFGDEQAEE
jgi:hypothetical protein